MNKVRPGAVKSLRRGGSVLAAQAVELGMPDALWRAAQAGMRRRKRARELEGLANARRPRCRFSRKLTDWCACVQAPLSGCTQGGDLMNAIALPQWPAQPGLCTSASVSAKPRAAQDCVEAQALPLGRAQPKTAHKRKHCRPAAHGRDCAQAQALSPGRAQPGNAHRCKHCRPAARSS